MRRHFFHTISALPILATGLMASAQAPAPPSLDVRLARHVHQVASVEHNTSKPATLEDAATYIETTLAALGYSVKRQQYAYVGHMVRNLEVSLINSAGKKPPERIFIVGAHVDCAPGAPGANDNGSSTAAVLELARMLRGIHLGQGTELKFVFFVNQEPSYFSGAGVSRWQHATDLHQRGQPGAAALILETPGSPSQAKGRQPPPPGLEKIYPNQGNFIAFVGTQASSEMVRKALAAFKAASPFAAEGLAAASYVEGVTWSGQPSYNRYGYPAIMVTDTAFLRYPYYHTGQDTPAKLDYASMARVVEGLAKVIEAIAAPTRM